MCTKRVAEAPMTIRIAPMAATMAKRRRGVGSNDDEDGNSGISNDDATDDEGADCHCGGFNAEAADIEWQRWRCN